MAVVSKKPRPEGTDGGKKRKKVIREAINNKRRAVALPSVIIQLLWQAVRDSNA